MSDELLIVIITTIGSIIVAYITTIFSNKKISHAASKDADNNCEHKAELEKVQAIQNELLIRLGKALNKIDALEAQIAKGTSDGQ